MKRLTRIVKQVLGLFPRPLPTGVSAFNAYVADIISTYALPTSDLDSIKYAIATRILGFGSNRAYASKFSFVCNIYSACAKQVAGNAFQEIKQAQKARQLAEEAAQKAAVTALPVTDAPSI